MVATSRSGGDRKSRGKDKTRLDGAPAKPRGMKPKAAAKWDEVVSQLPEGALRRVDCHQLRILCELLVKLDALFLELEGNSADMAKHRLLVALAQHVHRLSAVFGLSPSDRQRIKVEETVADDDPVAELMAKISK